MVKSSADALLELLNDILDLSKIEAGKSDLRNVDFDLRAGLTETMKALAVRAHQKGLELVLDIRPEVPGVVSCDPARPRQILWRLVGNATKFTDCGEIVPRVRLESHLPDGVLLHFSARDTGIGIDPRDQQRILSAVEQIYSPITGARGGTGLDWGSPRNWCDSLAARSTSRAGRGKAVVSISMRSSGCPPGPRGRLVPRSTSVWPIFDTLQCKVSATY
jgi:signal transduction histidine kinase